jgi:hypothetical protein
VIPLLFSLGLELNASHSFALKSAQGSPLHRSPALTASISALKYDEFLPRYLHSFRARREELVSVSDSVENSIYEYDVSPGKPRLIRTLTGLSHPGGLALDNVDDLLVANENASNVLKFLSDGAGPIIYSDTNQLPNDVASCQDGMTYAASAQDIAVYKHGSHKPDRYVTVLSGGSIISSITCDRESNVYILADTVGGIVVKYSSGLKGIGVTLPMSVPDPEGIRVTRNGDIVISYQYNYYGHLDGVVGFFHSDSSSSYKQISLPEDDSAALFSLDQTENHLWIATNGRFEYPVLYDVSASDGHIVREIDGVSGGAFWGVAVCDK